MSSLRFILFLTLLVLLLSCTSIRPHQTNAARSDADNQEAVIESTPGLPTSAINHDDSVQSADLQIELVHNDAREEQTKEQLLRLISTYELDRWLFTKRVNIDSDFRTVPHSHPVLTLNTRHLKDDELLLATFIHEQFHWYIGAHPAKEVVLERVKEMYPEPVVGFPGGSGGEVDTYYHIIICYLEYRGLKQLLGELKAYQVITFWEQDHYWWIYKTVLEDQRQLESLVRELNILP